MSDDERFSAALEIACDFMRATRLVLASDESAVKKIKRLQDELRSADANWEEVYLAPDAEAPRP